MPSSFAIQRSGTPVSGRFLSHALKISCLVAACLLLTPPQGAVAAPPQCLTNLVANVFAGNPTVLPAAPCSDPDGDALTMILVSGPDHGTLSPQRADGTRIYTAAADYVGEDVVRFKASDGVSESGVSTLTITVQAGRRERLGGDPVLFVSVVGASGTVASSSAGIGCPTICFNRYPTGSVVTLQAKAATGLSRFVVWEGACIHARHSPQCTVVVNDDTRVVARFRSLAFFKLVRITRPTNHVKDLTPKLSKCTGRDDWYEGGCIMVLNRQATLFMSSITSAGEAGCGDQFGETVDCVNMVATALCDALGHPALIGACKAADVFTQYLNSLRNRARLRKINQAALDDSCIAFAVGRFLGHTNQPPGRVNLKRQHVVGATGASLKYRYKKAGLLGTAWKQATIPGRLLARRCKN